MDNLTHSMVGAVLGQMGLKRRSGLAMPTLIIAANLPDIDAACTVWGTQSLAMRRGLTHGPLALLLLPLVLTGLMVAFDRWQARRGSRPERRLPVRPGWLLLLAYIGTLSHPALDWLNSYGIRLLEPFSSRWFYGDTLFIADIWLLALLVAGFWISYRKERRDEDGWAVPAGAAFTAACVYIFANGLITGHAERQTARLLTITPRKGPVLVVASPVPAAFWRRTMLWRDGQNYGKGRYSLLGGVTLDGSSTPIGMNDPRITLIRRTNPDARALLFWARMPVAKMEGRDIVLGDQRFLDAPVAGPFTVRVSSP